MSAHPKIIEAANASAAPEHHFCPKRVSCANQTVSAWTCDTCAAWNSCPQSTAALKEV